MAIGFIVYGTYRTQGKTTKVYLFGRLLSGESFLIIKTCRPYFYITTADTEKAKALKEAAAFEFTSTDFKNFAGEPMTKVTVQIPGQVKDVRDIFVNKGIQHYEADIRFVTRFLIDHEIRGLVEINGEYRVPNPDTEFVDVVFDEPDVQGPEDTSQIPELNVISFDIETTPDGKTILCLSLYGKIKKDNETKEITKAWIINRHAVTADTVKDEKELLEKFTKAIKELDPDVLVGWNVIDFDLALLRDKYKQYGLPMVLGRMPGECKLDIQENYFSDSKADFLGRQVLDGIHLMKGAFVKLEDYKLNTAAKHFLGKEKTIVGEDRFLEIHSLYTENPQKLVEYNIHDAELVIEILEKSNVLGLAMRRSMLAGMFLDRVKSSVASLDFVYISEARKRKLVVPSGGYAERGERIKGGFVQESKPGVYKNILVLDFKSLYPSIIRTFNIDPKSYVPPNQRHLFNSSQAIIAPNGAMFKNEDGILSDILKTLWAQRDAAKKRKDTLATHAIKILMNSMFGVLANPSCRFYNLEVANAITHFGQHINKLTTKKINEKGYEVIYGDTDSVFVNPKKDTSEESNKIGEELQTYINDFYKNHVTETYHRKNVLEIQFEKLYSKFLMPRVRGTDVGAKKRYAGIRVVDGKEKLEFVGMEVVRRDWTELAKKFQTDVLNLVFRDEDPSIYIKEFIKDLKAGKHDALLVYKKALRKEASEYTKTTPPHVKAARILGKKDFGIIEYVMTTNGPEPIQKRSSTIDYEHYIDKQVKPLADSILCFYGTSFDDLIKGAQKKLFDF
ncbi:MAG: DNA polymerase II [Candidatus Woesearchaeota archaeon]|nr:DNA polymerase II [Candidatus Woesearchaeota archaeon]